MFSQSFFFGLELRWLAFRKKKFGNKFTGQML